MSILDPKSEQYKTLRFYAIREKMYIAMCAADQADQWTYEQHFEFATNATRSFIEELDKIDD